MNDLAELGAMLRRHQDSRLDQPGAHDQARDAFLRAFRQRELRPTRTARRWALVGGVVAAAAALVLVVWLQRPRALSASVVGEDRALFVGDEVRAPGESTALQFSDGSRIELGRGAQVRMHALGPHGASVGLVRGKLRVAVEHRPDTAWSLQAGPYSVHVTGTRFDLAWQQRTGRFQLDLLEGEVRVSGGPLLAERIVRAGQSLVLPQRGPMQTAYERQEPAHRAALEPSVERSRATDRLPVAGRGTTTVEPKSATQATSWLEQARAGEYSLAYEQAARVGFEKLTQSAPARELIVLADVARFSGHGKQARSALTAIRDRFGGSNEAATAAFQLGRLSGDTPEAARWFRTYLNERPAGSLAREASGRLMELLSRLGNEKAARAQARDYLGRYPAGPHAAFARKLTHR